jgi:hypothetical protein
MERHRFDRPIATIGRAFDNDIIVHDPYVDAHHLRVTNDLNGLAIEKTSTDGYTTISHKDVNEPRVPISSGTQIEIGKTHLRIFSTTHAVAPVLKFERIDRLFTTLTRPSFIVMLTIAYLLLDFGNSYLSRFQEVTLATQALGVLTSLLPALAWAGFWAFVSRVSRGEPRFFHHWIAVLMALSLVIVFDRVQQVVAFNFASLTLNQVLNYIAMAITLVFLLTINMRFAFRQRTWVRHAFAYGTTAALVAYLVLTTYSFTREFRPVPQFDSTLLPQALLGRDSISENQFLAGIDTLFTFPTPSEEDEEDVEDVEEEEEEAKEDEGEANEEFEVDQGVRDGDMQRDVPGLDEPGVDEPGVDDPGTDNAEVNNDPDTPEN